MTRLEEDFEFALHKASEYLLRARKSKPDLTDAERAREILKRPEFADLFEAMKLAKEQEEETANDWDDSWSHSSCSW